MINIRSKFSVSSYVPVRAWLRQGIVSVWGSLPDRFSKPYQSDLKFGFVVGCGHSGTTLTAAKLGRHSTAFLIGRETNAFGPGMGAHCSRRIVSEWSYFAQQAGKRLILEKTPKHVHAVRKIYRLLPDSKIIATVRNPLDNIGSLYARFGDLDGAIARWIMDNKVVLSLQNSSFCKIVKYETLTQHPVAVFGELADFLDLPWERQLLEEGDTAYDFTHREENMAIRATQVREQIKPRINTWHQNLTDPQAEKVFKKTNDLAQKLGYLYTESNSDGLQ